MLASLCNLKGTISNSILKGEFYWNSAIVATKLAFEGAGSLPSRGIFYPTVTGGKQIY
jgi:hypothetical protein